MKRIIRIWKNDFTYDDLILSKVTEIKTDQILFHLDKLKDGTFRLTYSGEIIKYFPAITHFEIVRED